MTARERAEAFKQRWWDPARGWSPQLDVADLIEAFETTDWQPRICPPALFKPCQFERHSLCPGDVSAQRCSCVCHHITKER